MKTGPQSRLSDELWAQLEPLLPGRQRDESRRYQRRPGGGRKPLDSRRVFEAILLVLKTGTQWKSLPKEIYGSPSSIHAYFKIWSEAGVFQRIWETGLAEHEELQGIAWMWERIDSTGVQASAYVQRSKPGLKHLAEGEFGEAQRVWRPVSPRWRRR